MSPPLKRVYLGQKRSMAGSQRVYRAAHAVEIDEIENYDVVQRRVFYEDILLITHHQFIDASFLVVNGILFCGAWLLAIALLANAASRPVGLGFLALGFPFALAFVLRLALKVDAVTVYGN